MVFIFGMAQSVLESADFWAMYSYLCDLDRQSHAVIAEWQDGKNKITHKDVLLNTRISDSVQLKLKLYTEPVTKAAEQHQQSSVCV